MARVGDFAGARMALVPVTADDGTTVYQLEVAGAGGSSGGTGASASQVQGTSPTGSAAVGNPVLTGYLRSSNSTVRPIAGDNTDADAVSGQNGINVRSFGLVWNDTAGQWARQRGDTKGASTHLPASTVDTAQSGTIATSGGTASLTFDATSRAEVLNPSTGTFWARWGAAPAINGAGSFPIAAGGSYSPGYGTTGTLQLLSTAAGQPYTHNRMS